MPAADETTDDSFAGRDQSEAQERAEAGAARSGRRTGRSGRSDGSDGSDRPGLPGQPGRRTRFRVIVTVALLLLALAAVRGAGLGSGGSTDDAGNEGGNAARSSTTEPSGTTASTATTAPAQGTTSSSVAPPDVARPRPAVDLAARPPATDPVEVARWWAATFVAYGAAEPAADLVARLDPYTTPNLRTALLEVPPAASYDAPVEIAGVSAQPDPATAASPRPVVTVSVETPGALVVYRLALVQGSAGWQVDEANRL